ncbi:hypothetical protein PR048_029090 [Dryococelus australis]|uniref:Reverse transcriptase domain-containing protein n=1 Tax=Dryococelus australis TaxID=614101 RepID=A0ABQ9GCD4_9NEOP|nr:hypothetical protein PR048_029090 [Dryococelus australis]
MVQVKVKFCQNFVMFSGFWMFSKTIQINSKARFCSSIKTTKQCPPDGQRKIENPQALNKIILTDDSRKYCTFSTVYGCYSFNVLPFWLEISSEAFQEICEAHFGDIQGLFIYIYDFLIFAESKQEHGMILDKILLRAKDLNIKFNIK